MLLDELQPSETVKQLSDNNARSSCYQSETDICLQNVTLYMFRNHFSRNKGLNLIQIPAI